MRSNCPDIGNTLLELKNKRSGLKDACQRLEREIEKIHIPQVMNAWPPLPAH